MHPSWDYVVNDRSPLGVNNRAPLLGLWLNVSFTSRGEQSCTPLCIMVNYRSPLGVNNRAPTIRVILRESEQFMSARTIQEAGVRKALNLSALNVYKVKHWLLWTR